MQPETSLTSYQKLDLTAAHPLTRGQSAYLPLKRILDLVVTIPGLILIFPIMVLIAILIRLDSPGPALFVQTRVGAKKIMRNGRPCWQRCEFPIYKFRTMICNVDPALHQEYINAFINNYQEDMAALQGRDVQTHKLVADPRVTRIGRFLRKSSLDELPQLFNVVRGEMSLVGPRPAIPYEVDLYESWHLRRLDVKPGLTGWWQVTARSSANFDEMVRLDLDYIEHQSLWLDLKILVKTPIVVLLGKGAH